MLERSLICEIRQEQNVSLISYPTPIKSLPDGKKSSAHSLILLLMRVNVLMHVLFLRGTVQMGVLRLKVLIVIRPKVQWNMTDL